MARLTFQFSKRGSRFAFCLLVPSHTYICSVPSSCFYSRCGLFVSYLRLICVVVREEHADGSEGVVGQKGNVILRYKEISLPAQDVVTAVMRINRVKCFIEPPKRPHLWRETLSDSSTERGQDETILTKKASWHISGAYLRKGGVKKQILRT
jgi:hypothetical protein